MARAPYLPGVGGTYSDGTPAPLGSRVPTGDAWYGPVGLPYKPSSRVVMNVGNPNYQTWANAYFLSQMQSGGFTGLFVDDSDGGDGAPFIPQLGTVTPSGSQVFNEYATDSGMNAAAADWCSGYVACLAAAKTLFATVSPPKTIYANVANYGTNWTALLPDVDGVYRELLIYPYQRQHRLFYPQPGCRGRCSSCGCVERHFMHESLRQQSAHLGTVLSGVFLPRLRHVGLAVLSHCRCQRLFLLPGCQYRGIHWTYYNFGALDYNVGAHPIASGDTPVVASTGPYGRFTYLRPARRAVIPPTGRWGTGTWIQTLAAAPMCLFDPTKNWPVDYWVGPGMSQMPRGT